MGPMGYRSIETVRVIPAPPEAIWPYLIDPGKLSDIGDHHVDIESDRTLTGARGESWVEQHGPECDDDRVKWTVIESDTLARYRIRGRQRGITQVVDYSVEPVTGGSRVTERIVFSPSLAGAFGQQFLPWALLGSGLLGKLSQEQATTLEDMEREIAASRE